MRMVTKEARNAHDIRAEQVAGLRALADFIEKNPQLPSPSGVTVYAHNQTREAVQTFALAYGVEYREYDDAGRHWWTARHAVAMVGCHPVEYRMAGSEPIGLAVTA